MKDIKALRLKLQNIPKRSYEVLSQTVNEIQDRYYTAQSPTGASLKPLDKKYGAWKKSKGRKNQRDLSFSGQLYNSMQVLTGDGENEIRFMGRRNDGQTNNEVMLNNIKRDRNIWVFNKQFKQKIVDKILQD